MILSYEQRMTKANKWRKQLIFNKTLIIIDYLYFDFR